jgi:hypothetical protein
MRDRQRGGYLFREHIYTVCILQKLSNDTPLAYDSNGHQFDLW